MSNPVNDRKTSAVVSAFLRRFVKDGGYTANPYRQWVRHVGSDIILTWNVGFERTTNPEEPSDVVVQHEVASLDLLAVQDIEPADFLSPHISLACREVIGPKPGLLDSDVILRPPLRPEDLEDYCNALECAMITMEMDHESIQTTEDLIQYRATHPSEGCGRTDHFEFLVGRWRGDKALLAYRNWREYVEVNGYRN